jgi:hypothetical protein
MCDPTFWAGLLYYSYTFKNMRFGYRTMQSLPADLEEIIIGIVAELHYNDVVEEFNTFVKQHLSKARDSEGYEIDPFDFTWDMRFIFDHPFGKSRPILVRQYLTMEEFMYQLKVYLQ